MAFTTSQTLLVASPWKVAVSSAHEQRPQNPISLTTELEFLLELFRRRASGLSGDDANAGWNDLREIAISLAGLLRDAADQNDLPVRLKPILQLRSGRLTMVPHKEEGTLLPRDYGFEVRVQFGIPLARLRATVAHELGHTLFYNVSAMPPVRVLVRSELHHRREEALCWDFARELLLPRAAFLDVSGPYPSPQTVLRLARMFCVSPQLICRRAFYDLGIWQEGGAFILTPSDGTGQFHSTVYIGRTMKRSLRRTKLTLRGKDGLISRGGAWHDRIVNSAAQHDQETEFCSGRLSVQVRRYGARKDVVLGVFTTDQTPRSNHDFNSSVLL